MDLKLKQVLYLSLISEFNLIKIYRKKIEILYHHKFFLSIPYLYRNIKTEKYVVVI